MKYIKINVKTLLCAKAVIPEKELEKLYQSKDRDKYFITYTELEKVGINPNNKYGTPTGIYTYPLKYLFKNYNKFNSHKLDQEFASDSEFINILKLNTNKILDNTASESDYKRVCAKIKQIYDKNKKDIQEGAKVVEHFNSNHIDSFDNVLKVTEYCAKRHADLYKHKYSPFVKIWYLIFLFSLWLKGEGHYQHYWNKLLRDFGYDVVIDNNENIIHVHQTSQAVFLTPTAYKIIKRLDNIDKDKYIKIKNKFYNINEIPDNAVITDVDRLNTNFSLKRLPNNLHVKGTLILTDSIKFLPPITIDGSLNINSTKIKELPDNLIVNGDLYIDDTLIHKLPLTMKIKGTIWIDKDQIDNLQKAQKIYDIKEVYKMY